MKLKQLQLNKYKKFDNRTIDFQPNLNIIWGENESGKSTVYNAIVNVFFGKERGKSVENWNGGSSSVSIRYSIGDEEYQLDRMFTDGIARLSKLINDEPTDIVTAKDSIATMVAKHFGITSRVVLDNTIFIKQSDMSRPETSDLSIVGDEIQRILTGTAHTNATEAIRNMEISRDEIKGRPRPTNQREYDRINTRISSLAEETANAKRSRDRIVKLSDELLQLDIRIEQDSARKETLNLLIEKHKRWAELKKQETAFDNRYREIYYKIKDIDETAKSLNEVQNELLKYSSLIGNDEQINNQLITIKNKINELEIKIAEIDGSYETQRTTTGNLTFVLLVSFIALICILSVIAGITLDPLYFLIVLPAIAIIVLYRKQANTNQALITKHHAESRSTASNNLNQIHNEEKSILNYLNASDIDDAIKKIQTYRQLTAKFNELEIKHKTLIADKTPDEWKSIELEVNRDLNFVRNELETDYLGYEPTTEESVRWQSEYSALNKSLPAAINRRNEIKGALDTENRNIKDIATLNGEMEFLQSRRKELDFLYNSYETAISILKKVTGDISLEYLPVLSQKASSIMNRITRDRYDSVSIETGWDIKVNSKERSSISPEILSTGTIDQLYFSLRLACGEILTNERNLPIILDDPFASFDENRLKESLEMLIAISETNQILLLTHDPQIPEWAKNNSGNCNLILL